MWRKLAVALFLGHFLIDALIVVAVGGWVHREEVPEVERLAPIQAKRPAALDSMMSEVGGSEEIAAAILREAAATGMDPRLILGIIRVENPMLDPTIENWYGAVGLMQVVGWLHGGEYPECGDDLTDVATNICYGTRIYQHKLGLAGGNQELALRLYNGCWGETYTQGCEVYSARVVERGDVQ